MTSKTDRPTRPAVAGKAGGDTRVVDTLRDPLILPNGQVLPNRIMKAARNRGAVRPVVGRGTDRSRDPGR